MQARVKPGLVDFAHTLGLKARSTKLVPYDGLRGTGGPQDRLHTARHSEDQKTLYIVAGPNELSPLVARIKLTAKVAKALRDGDLESLDGIEVLDGESKLKFGVDGRDFQNKPRLRLTGVFSSVAFKISGCSPYREAEVTL